MVVLVLILLSCGKPTTDDMSLCKEFWRLNKHSTFVGLHDLFIESRNTVRDSESGIYNVIYTDYSIYDTLLRCYVKFPMVDRNASRDELANAYGECDSVAIRFLKKRFEIIEERELLEEYIELTRMVLLSVDSIKLPNEYPFSNVMAIQGRPRQSIITFKLTTNSLVFFVEDKDVVLTEYWEQLTRGAEKFDEHWYCRIESK